jgi:membrane-associated phospholipid phosphatase
LAATLVLKLCFLPCGHLIPEWQLHSPSGHAAASFAAYGGFAVLESRLRTLRWQRVLILTSGLAFAALIAASRVVLHAHTLPEVLLGSAVGLAVPAILLWRIKSFSRGTIAKPLLLALFLPLILLIVFHGKTLPVEGLIASVAQSLARTLGICA